MNEASAFSRAAIASQTAVCDVAPAAAATSTTENNPDLNMRPRIARRVAKMRVLRHFPGMMKLCLVRHGPTDWNAQGRVQGTIDIPLSEEGKARMSALRPPEGFDTVRAYASPKLRARQTAACLGLKQVTLDARLTEQNWGDWEGLTRAEMQARDGEDAFIKAGSLRGLAFRPPGGESTGELHARLQSFFQEVALRAEDAIAVTHMGVLRAAYVLATGWDMSAPMPPELDLKCALVLELSPDGKPVVAQLNVPLRAR